MHQLTDESFALIKPLEPELDHHADLSLPTSGNLKTLSSRISTQMASNALTPQTPRTLLEVQAEPPLLNVTPITSGMSVSVHIAQPLADMCTFAHLSKMDMFVDESMSK
jgi:hypothetical protein